MKRVLYKKRILLVIFSLLLCVSCVRAMRMQSQADLANLFPKSSDEITAKTKQYIYEAQEKIDKIIAIKPQNRSFETVALALDRVSSFNDLTIFLNVLRVVELVNPDTQVREVAQDNILNIENFFIEQVSNNKRLYEVLFAYNQVVQRENLSEQQKYFLQETIKNYQRLGLGLPEKKLEKIKILQKELGLLQQQYGANIAIDKTKVIVKPKYLAGMDRDFIGALEKNGEGDCILGLDYPTYFAIMDSCEIEETRKKMYIAFNNRAYPENKAVLQEIMEKRDELAKILGFESYVHFDLDDQMAKTPQRVLDFLVLLRERSEKKAQKEFKLLSSNLPAGVTLTQDNKIKPWDEAYIKKCYKKKYFNIDQQKIVEYFPTKHVISKMFELCEQFFGVRFNVTQVKDLWHEDVILVELYSGENILIGYILLDLYPRKNKFTHACSEPIVPVVTGYGPGANIIVTNFAKPTQNKPSLMSLFDMKVLFHELGHALHALLGRTDLATFAGFNVKDDFVEAPSQMLDEWPTQKEILKKISCHYKTKEVLSDEDIEKIVKLDSFAADLYVQERCFKSFLSLQYFSKNQDTDPKKIYDDIRSTMRSHIAMCEQNNMYASFIHLPLPMYAAKYYCYLWAKVFSIDILYEIKKHGFANAEIGKKYVQEVLSKGGSVDPGILLKNFLGRATNYDAFFDRYGLI